MAAVAVEAVVADLAGAAQREHSEVVNSLVMAVYREEPRPRTISIRKASCQPSSLQSDGVYVTFSSMI